MMMMIHRNEHRYHLPGSMGVGGGPGCGHSLYDYQKSGLISY